MKIISLSMVKNEQDIIEPFIRHHLKLVDHMEQQRVLLPLALRA